jgi:ABC-type phosphate transport system permease subunit
VVVAAIVGSFRVAAATAGSFRVVGAATAGSLRVSSALAILGRMIGEVAPVLFLALGRPLPPQTNLVLRPFHKP